MVLFPDLAASAWAEQRRPLADEAQDAARCADYWSWSGQQDFAPVLLPAIAAAPDGRQWVQLRNAGDADYEAFFMQHSIGYNWEHYSRFGDILSLRDVRGIPSVTMLVADGQVIHARRRENAPLLDEDFLAVELLAEQQGWSVADRESL